MDPMGIPIPPSGNMNPVGRRKFRVLYGFVLDPLIMAILRDSIAWSEDKSGDLEITVIDDRSPRFVVSTASNQGAGRAAARLGRFLLASAPVILHFVAHTGKLGAYRRAGLITGKGPHYQSFGNGHHW